MRVLPGDEFVQLRSVKIKHRGVVFLTSSKPAQQVVVTSLASGQPASLSPSAWIVSGTGGSRRLIAIGPSPSALEYRRTVTPTQV